MNLAFKAACVQTTTGPNIDQNITHASELIYRAKNLGANFISLPEMVNIIEMNPKELATKTTTEANDPMLAAIRELAARLDVWILVGSLVVKHDNAQDEVGRSKFANRSLLIQNTGAVCARYDKIHMFDANLESGETFRESKVYEPGSRLTLAKTPWGLMGLTVCYDLRFPQLYRDLTKAGAVILSAPSAFTRSTGQAHWHILAQARAIENGCFVIAAAQCGFHGRGRHTYGHSLIVAPWGEILADGNNEPGVIVADVDLNLVEKARKNLPSIYHDRFYSFA